MVDNMAKGSPGRGSNAGNSNSGGGATLNNATILEDVGDLKKALNQLKNLDHEEYMAFHKNGTKIVHNKGETFGVSQMSDKFNKNVVTDLHNHPLNDSASFSGQDIANLINSAYIKESIVVDASGNVAIFRKTKRSEKFLGYKKGVGFEGNQKYYKQVDKIKKYHQNLSEKNYNEYNKKARAEYKRVKNETGSREKAREASNKIRSKIGYDTDKAVAKKFGFEYYKLKI